jgi:hypothetical protein
MPRSRIEREPIPERFERIEQVAEFWDTHSLADYWDLTREAHVEVDLKHRRYLIALEPELAAELAAEAHKRGVSAETLANLWLREKLHGSAA